SHLSDRRRCIGITAFARPRSNRLSTIQKHSTLPSPKIRCLRSNFGTRLAVPDSYRKRTQDSISAGQFYSRRAEAKSWTFLPLFCECVDRTRFGEKSTTNDFAKPRRAR